MNERYWYQDGDTVVKVVIAVAVIGALIYGSMETARHNDLPHISPMVSGQIEPGFFGPTNLVITVWHQHPASLRNVVLTVSLPGNQASGGPRAGIREHSFESWAPNKDHGVKFRFPLKNFDATREIEIKVELEGKTIKPTVESMIWLGYGWKRNP